MTESQPSPEPDVRTVRLTVDPRTLRRLLIAVLVAVAFYQISGWLFYNLKSFLGLLFLAWLFSITLEPVVHWLNNRGLRRGAATGIVLIGLFLASGAFIAVFGTLLAEQFAQLLRALPATVGRATSWANETFDTDFEVSRELIDLSPDGLRDIAERFTPGLLSVLSTLLGAIFQTLTFLLFVFYMSAQGPQMRRTIARRFPARQQMLISKVWETSVEKAGGYVVSRMILAVCSTFATAIVLLILDVPYWLPLALWTGIVSQFIPTLGTYLAIALPALVAAAADPVNGLWVVGFGMVYQQIENYVLQPRITSRTVDIHPAVAFASVIVGAALFGAAGALVAVPVIAVLQALFQSYAHRYELVGEEQPEQDTDEEAGQT
jgi:predicted PurR-regulated permease PerM